MNKYSTDTQLVPWKGTMVNKYGPAEMENLQDLVNEIRYANKIDCS